jgi:hypothetical protein
MAGKLLIGVGLLAVCMIILLTWSLLQPTDKTLEETYGSYVLEGEFSYNGYYYSNSSQTNPVLFIPIMDELEIHFYYSDSESLPVAFKVILTDRNDTWQKEFPVQPSNDTTTSFSLDFNDLLSFGATVNEELGLKDNGYHVKIVADVGLTNDPFEVILEGQLNSNTLTWDSDSFIKLERGYPGSNQWVYGSYGYTAKLKENSLYGPITIEREATIPEIQLLPAGSTFFPDTIESLDIYFNYTFLSDIKVNSLVSDYKVEMLISEQDRWAKTFTLIENTGVPGNFNISIPIDIDKLIVTITAINQQVSGRSIGEQDIIFMAEVHSKADTNAGIIDETFNQELKGIIRDKIQWDTTSSGQEGFTLTKNALITNNITVSDRNVMLLRIFSAIGLVLALGFLAAFSLVYVRKQRSGITPRKEQKIIHKKYGHLISKVSTFPHIGEGEELVKVLSIEDLVTISNNSLKPILFKADADQNKYLVMDNSKWYIYSD